MVTSDYGLWIRWMRGTCGGATKSWSMWYNEENGFYQKLLFSSKLFFLLKAALLLQREVSLQFNPNIPVHWTSSYIPIL